MLLRGSLRALRAAPGTTAASFAILALGIGAATAVFSVVNGLLLRPLPVRDQDRLVRIWKNDRERGFPHYPVLYPEYLEWARRSESFESLAAVFSSGPFDGLLLGSSEPVRLAVATVSGNLFEVLGSSSALGRTLRSEDDRAHAVPPLVLSDRAWRERFGSDPGVIGRSVPLRVAERTRFQVVGVMPESFDLLGPADGWAPIMAVHPDWGGNLGCECDLIGRLGAGIAEEEALHELQAVHENLASEQPREYRSMRVELVPLLESVVGDSGRASALATGASGLLLIIAIANVSALSLIRALGRARETAVRSALGANTASLLRERLVESLLVSLAALALGLVLAHVALEALLHFKGAELPRVQGIGLDGAALVFAAGVAALATAATALIPLVVLGRRASLQSRSAGASSGRVMQWLVAGEVAFSVPLLFASGLLVRSLLATSAIDRGFESENLLTVEISLPVSKYPEPESRLALFEELVARVESIEGVVSASAAPRNPDSKNTGVSGPLVYEGQDLADSNDNPMTNIEMADPNHFAVFGIPILRGRAFSSFDRLETERVAIVSEDIAAAYWPGEDPIGKTVGYRDLRHRVVGVSGNTRYRELTRPWPTVYFPLRQNPFSAERRLHPFLTPGILAIRSRVPPENLIGSIRGVARSLDPELPLDRIATMEELLDRELRAPRFHALLFASFSLIGLALSAAGVYAVFAAFVAQRLPELGIRSAIGATPARLRALVLGRSRNILAAGISIGAVAAWWSSRWVGRLLYGVAAFDLPTLLGATVVIAFASLLATMVPARRAGRADPLALLKHE